MKIFGNHAGFFYRVEHDEIQVFPGGEAIGPLASYPAPSNATEPELHAIVWLRIDTNMKQLLAIADRRYNQEATAHC